MRLGKDQTQEDIVPEKVVVGHGFDSSFNHQILK